MSSFEHLGLAEGIQTTELHFSKESWVDLYNECHLAEIRYSNLKSQLSLRFIKFYDIGPLENGTEIKLILASANIAKLAFIGGLEDMGTLSSIEVRDEQNDKITVRLALGESSIEVTAKDIKVERKAADLAELQAIIQTYKETTGEKKFPGSELGI